MLKLIDSLVATFLQKSLNGKMKPIYLTIAILS